MLVLLELEMVGTVLYCDCPYRVLHVIIVVVLILSPLEWLLHWLTLLSSRRKGKCRSEIVDWRF